MDKRGIIVLGGHIQALGIIRILGREGIPSIIIDKTRNNISRHSRYCKSFVLCPDNNLLNFLMTIGENGNCINWVLFPTNDFHVKLLSFNKQLLEKYFKVSVDIWNVIEIFYNKIRSYKLIKELQIPLPSTFFPLDISDIKDLPLDFPCIIKPAIMHNFYEKTKKKVFKCNSMEELLSNYEKALNIIPKNEIIIQEIIKGTSKNQFSACFLFVKGTPILYLSACRMRQHPIDFGNATTYAETISIPKIIEYGSLIMKEVNYTGLCEIEFKYDEKDRNYKFLEVNTRTWKWHTIANKSNVPFLKYYYNYLNGENIEPIHEFKEASFRHFLTDFPTQLTLFFKGYYFAFHLRKPIEKAVWSSDDKAPWFFEKFYLFYFLRKR